MLFCFLLFLREWGGANGRGGGEGMDEKVEIVTPHLKQLWVLRNSGDLI